MTAAYQPNAYQKNAYQTDAIVALPSFQADAFQFGAFQQDEPQPPEPMILDGHDAGRRKRALKKLQELENQRIAMIKEQAERRKLEIRFAVDPQAKAEYEAKLQAQLNQGKPVKDINKEIAKIDEKIGKIQSNENKVLQEVVRAELQSMLIARQIREQEIRRQIQEADDELALLMMM